MKLYTKGFYKIAILIQADNTTMQSNVRIIDY